MILWNRYHRNNDDEWFIRPDGGGPGGIIFGNCLLLLSGPADELLLLG